MKKINKIEPSVPSFPTRKRVAAYARVSVARDRTEHSLSMQISYYNAFIQKHPEWEYAGVYADFGRTGTSDNRKEWQRMLADCKAGKIDIVLTKSISRFSRNTVDLIETVRRLQELGVEVRFEKENISSMSDDGELMMTILASFAQEESCSISENVKWAIRKGFKEGKPNSFCVYGYRYKNGVCEVVPEEAEVVRLIYRNYLSGLSAEQTAGQLDEMGVKSYHGLNFNPESIRGILRNERYTGVLKLQKTFIRDHISHKSAVNRGELPMYLVEDAHEAIIDKATFEAVQAEIARRRKLGAVAYPNINTTAFTSKVKCGLCGANYHRKNRKEKNGDSYRFWRCAVSEKHGSAVCSNRCVREEILKEKFAEILGLDEFGEAVFTECVREIIVNRDKTLTFRFADGSEATTSWERHSDEYTWTEERRQAMRERTIEQNRRRAKK